mmetsp:Transcript_9551/g.23549  ORF Transcript_9551/g.23549 Transcript_9551/m.23549 type:complete len:200 (-) Transcript_9551:829-1428(-)
MLLDDLSEGFHVEAYEALQHVDAPVRLMDSSSKQPCVLYRFGYCNSPRRRLPTDLASAKAAKSTAKAFASAAAKQVVRISRLALSGIVARGATESLIWFISGRAVAVTMVVKALEDPVGQHPISLGAEMMQLALFPHSLFAHVLQPIAVECYDATQRLVQLHEESPLVVKRQNCVTPECGGSNYSSGDQATSVFRHRRM